MSKEMIYQSKREVSVLDKGTYKGYDYLILSLGTHPCAYVRLKKTHPCYKLDYGEIDVDVHGGLTYASEKVSQSDKKGWWIGWDYTHLGDYSGYDEISGMGDFNARKYTTNNLIHDTENAIDQLIDMEQAKPKSQDTVTSKPPKLTIESQWPVEVNHDCTAEIIAELERLLPEVDRYPDGTSPQWVTRIKDRIKELSGGSNNE